MEVYLVRHTETIFPKGICYGQSDVSLKIPYKDQFDKIVKQFNLKNGVIYASPLIRCSLLAQYVSEHNKNFQPIIKDDRLMEMNFGSWEQKNWDDINPDEMKEWMSDFVNVKVPNGESFTELYERVNNFIDHELLKSKNEHVIIVTHAGVIRSFLCRAMNLELKDAFQNNVEYGAIVKIEVSDGKFLSSQ